MSLGGEGQLLPAHRALCYWRGKRAKKRQGSAMRINPKEGSPAMDYAEHMKTYKLFCKLTAFAILAAVVVMVLLAVFVA